METELDIIRKKVEKIPDIFIMEHDEGCDFGWWDYPCTCGVYDRFNKYIDDIFDK